MASPTDFCSLRLTYSLTIRSTEVWRSPLGDSNLWLSNEQVPPARNEDTNGQVYRAGRPHVKLHGVETNAKALIEVIRSMTLGSVMKATDRKLFIPE